MKKHGAQQPANALDWDVLSVCRQDGKPEIGVVTQSIRSALDGDTRWLAGRLRRGSASPKEMALAADLIEKKIRPRRPRSGKPTREMNDAIVQVVLYMEAFHPDWQRSKTIIPDVAKAFRVSQKHVYNVLSKRKNTWVELPTTHFVEAMLARK